jgi:hypothetical protein
MSRIRACADPRFQDRAIGFFNLKEERIVILAISSAESNPTVSSDAADPDNFASDINDFESFEKDSLVLLQ